MSDSSFKENWIQFDGIKYTTRDFIKSSLGESTEPLNAIIQFIKDWHSDSRLISQKTSGSTGSPKVIEISKAQIKASAQATLKTLDLKAGDNALLCINPEYIGGKMMIARSLIGGLNLIITPIVSNPLKNYNLQETIDFFSFVPFQFEKILEESPNKVKLLDQAKVIILGGAPVSDGLANKIKSKMLKSRVYSTYGMTETVSHVALKLINSDKEENFKALQNIRFSIDERSCLQVHAPEISGQDTVITNDVVNLINHTEFQWLGRFDYVINSGGIKIHPEILEKEINNIFKENQITNRFFVFGLPDEKLGETVNLMLEGSIDQSFLQTILKENLQAYHTPRKISTTGGFVETESGKINRIETIKNLRNFRKS